jgi:hypothetical protein
VNYKTEELCQAAAKAVAEICETMPAEHFRTCDAPLIEQAEMTKPIDGGVDTYARVICVRRK